MARLRELLVKKRILNKKESLLAPSSFDVVGDIAIFNDFPKELRKKEKKIAETILKEYKHIKVVSKKSGKYAGRLRTPKLTILAGEKRKTTEHKESSCRFKLDIEKCYFSVRSSTERLRVAKKVKKNESVLVLFSGVAPFPCVIAKHSKAKKVLAIEINRTAHKFAKENIKLNKLENVQVLQGDVKKILPSLKEKFDRIIMPLPKSAKDYLTLTKKYLKPKGVIHLYMFAEEDNFKEIKKNYKKSFKSVQLTKAGHFSPGTFRICLDLKK